MLPGPAITSTFGTLSVPYASAAIACAPPALSMRSAPQRSAAAMTAGCTFPPLAGVATKMCSTPAAFAGKTPIITELNSGAVPPGT